MKAFLHIGIEKTGTTTIQTFLAQNRTPLLQDGFLYPHCPGKTNHIKLVAYAAQLRTIEDIRDRLYGLNYTAILDAHKIEAFREQFRTRLRAELASTTATTVIFSSEHCSSRLITEAEIARLKALLEEFFATIDIVIYLRRQDDLLISSYSTKVICDGRIEPIGIPDPQIIDTYYDYKKILQKWESVFGKESIIVRIFDPQEFYNHDLLADFSQIVGYPINHRYQAVSRLNESYDAESLEFLRRMNPYIPRYVGDRINPNRQGLLQNLKGYEGHPYALVSKDFRTKFLSRFSESNAYIATHYMNRVDGTLFKDAISTEDSPVFSSFTSERAFEIFAYLWRKQAKEIQTLKQSENALKKDLSRRKNKLSKLFRIFNPFAWKFRISNLLN